MVLRFRLSDSGEDMFHNMLLELIFARPVDTLRSGRDQKTLEVSVSKENNQRDNGTMLCRKHAAIIVDPC